ncbi:MAG: peptidoglycan bridge formation glycyltransferase FemA/FemB family protein [Candidatus Uhrbacteria bacterium]|nr:aminoacyltransferase [Patescibacteria group bacterium]MBU1907288.1 aminoacyltransferase [Patescibacteria group bacterium]
MEIKPIEDKEQWNKFVAQHGPRSGAFLHSFEWGRFQEAIGRKVHRVGAFQGEDQIAAALVIEHSLPAGQKYVYCPRGPIFVDKKFNPEVLEEIARDFAAGSKAMFFRFEPPVETASTKTSRIIKPTVSVQPKETLILDLSLGMDELLAEMHHKTRYNMRLAEKKGVEVVELGLEDFDSVWDLFHQTATRNEFRLHEKSHYTKLFDSLPKSGEPAVRLIGARHEGDLIAAVINIDFAGTRTYLHGASATFKRNLMAPFAIHAHEITNAIDCGFLWYDLWGISDVNPNWKGITRFKRGFGGIEIAYSGTYDLILRQPQYMLYSLARKVLYGERY